MAGLPSPGGILGDAGEAQQARDEMLRALGAVRWRQRTVWRLTLHLSRGAALENAGICLHPVFGFAFLPGSGLKGLARAYAEMVWAPAQGEAPTELGVRTSQEKSIWQVFGRGPEPGGGEGSAGGVVFHEAWPVGWPSLSVDIVNSHHPQYYDQAKRGQDAKAETPPDARAAGWEPPGDWQSPVPVYFLTVPPKTGFEFALSLRDPAIPGQGKLLELAKNWLVGGLCELGAGAKTAAGYGYFAAEGK